MANVYTLKITYADCDEKIWRIAQVSDNYYLCQLGYMVLAAFETLAYHLFSISYNGVTYNLPTEFERVKPEECLFFVQLKDMQIKAGDRLCMIYDFGCDQVFDIEVLAIEPMKKGTGRAYPKILSGHGRGIIDDVPAFELLDIINEIDRTGVSTHNFRTSLGNEIIWDYRNYDLRVQNALLKSEIEMILEGYAAFGVYL